jgi:hypothetical protein
MGRYVCKTCLVEKDASEFRTKQKVTLKSGTREYRNCHCITCDNLHKLRYRDNNPYTWIANRYKISKEEASYWYERSMTSCEICGHLWKEGKEKLCIDHDHTTGKVRGILCKHCNHVLGHSRESLQILDNAKAYLMSHREEN